MSRYAISVGPQKWWADKNLRSLRFNSGDSAYLSRTPASTGTATTWTLSVWVKRSTLGLKTIFGAFYGNSNRYFLVRFNSLDQLNIDGGNYSTSPTSTNVSLTTSSVYRDCSAWMHIVFAYDTSNGTSADRARLYVNGARVSSFGTSIYPGPSSSTFVNYNTTPHYLGSFSPTLQLFDGYLADVHFIDGQALDPTSFGKFDNNGIWQPQTYFGDYGTNGFRLNFGDNTSTTTLGLDSSGQGNHWASNNLSVTAGAGNDSMVDHPVHYGFDTGVGAEVRGNYATLNPLEKGSSITLSNGNLDGSQASGGGTNTITLATIGVSSGKYYFEVTVNSLSGGTYPSIGLGKDFLNVNSPPNVSGAYVYYATGDKQIDGVSSAYGASWTTNDVIGIAFDADNGTLTFYKNGVSQGQAASGLTSGPYLPLVGKNQGAVAWSWSCNFGQRPFAYTAPSGFKALCTQNLPENTGITTSGTFTGNSSADGPFVYLNGIPTAMTINGNSVTFGTHADKLSNGFKVRNSTSSYNASGSNTFTISSTGDNFKEARAQENP